MSSIGSDEFGEVDEEDLILVATQAERQESGSPSQIRAESPEYRAQKRRRLNDPVDDQEQYSDGGSIGSRDTPISPAQSRDSTGNGEEDGSKSRPKSRHKIHIPRQADIPKDSFYTQLPRSSQSPYRIRGPYWQKPKLKSPSPSGIRESPERGQRQEDRVRWRSARSNDLFYNERETPTRSPGQPDEQHHNGLTGQNRFTQVVGSGKRASTALLDKSDTAVINELVDVPSDAFSSPVPIQGDTNEAIEVSSQNKNTQQWQSQATQPQRLVGPQANLRQTTLFGGEAQVAASQSQSTRRHNWPLAKREEPPTHHKLDTDALETWVYPTNLGSIRDYQYNIVARGLYHNLLVALPTGLGKTFIAATIMLNWFRWTKDAQIVFVAPTKPLVSQQVEACFNIVGIPRSATAMLTGSTPPGIRAEEWQSKRIFFMTPQTIVNDLKTSICDPKKIVLLVVDEAHRATGGYAYVEVVQFLRRFNTSFRVLALTATPGSTVEGVQEVIDGLGISRVEIRTEESLDIRQYVHSRKIDTVIFEHSEEMGVVMDLFAKALRPVLDKLNGMNAYWSKDPMALTPYGLTQARQKWMASDAGRKASHPIKGMVNTIFTLLASLAHSIELLKFHGIGPFFHKVTEFRNDTSSGEKGSKYRKQINDSEPFQKMMTMVQGWVSNSEFVGHPKLEYLRSVVLNHFLDAGDGRGAGEGVSPASTRIMVFVHYRDSAEEVARVLKRNEPMIRPHVFVGQANSKGSDGMDQKKQLDIIQKFKNGIYNTLVATSIGEEGLDIGEVDLIVCYDASASPIRMLQRMGRTGRKRAGNIVVTLMKGKEENNFVQAKDNYEKMQKMISAGTRFTFHEELSPRIVPRTVQPVVDKREIDIPLENTQSDLPEPRKRAKVPKRPPKKFHMPDGVKTGFTKASRLDNEESDASIGITERQPTRARARVRAPSPEPIPSLDSVLLTTSEERELERTYLDVGGDAPQIVPIPRIDAFPALQRTLRPFKHVEHGTATKNTVDMLKKMHHMTEAAAARYTEYLDTGDRKEGIAHAERRAAFFNTPKITPTADERTNHTACSPKSKLIRRSKPIISPRPSAALLSDDGDDDKEYFIDDAINDDVAAASSASSPPPLNPPGKLFYEPADTSYIEDLDSGDDLPEFDMLLERKSLNTTLTTVKEDDVNEPLRSTQRKGRRIVVESESDDDEPG